MTKWIIVVAGHPRVASGRPALLAQFFLPAFSPPLVQPVDVQLGIEVIKLVLHDAGEPAVRLEIHRITIDIEALESNAIGTLQRILQARHRQQSGSASCSAAS